MSLILKTQIQLVGNISFIIWDVSGTYNNPNNLGGWGAPNIQLGDILIATLSIESNTYTTPIVIDLGSYDASDIVTPTGLTITALQALGVDIFPDGYYKITLTLIDGNGHVYVYTNHQGFMYNISCCLRKKAAAIQIPLQNEKQILDASLAQYLLIAMGYAACCGNGDAYLNILDYLNIICEDCGRFTTAVTTFSPCGCK